MKHIIAVADWANDHLSNQEFLTAIEGFAKEPKDVRVSFVPSTPSTLHTAFLLKQLIYTQSRLGRPDETIFFHNTDPRMQQDRDIELAQGAPFVIAHLKNGVYVCGPNAGMVLSLLKPDIEELFSYEGVSTGSQFRSRDTLSRIVAHMADYMEQELELTEIHLHTIPDMENDRWFVGHIDNFGNIKTTLTADALKGTHELGETFTVTIGKTTKKVRYVAHMFAGHPGELVMFPGSSGPVEDPYLEISVWRHFDKGDHHTGAHEFEYPRPGDEVRFSKAKS